MRKSEILKTVVLVLVVWGCAGTRTQPARTTFPFSYENDPYEIVGLVAPTGDGCNFLIRREDGRVVLSAKDCDQNGTLDTLLTGAYSLEEANAIYAAGIAMAREDGRYQEHAIARSHVVTRPGASYTIQTYVLGPGRMFNKFIIDRARVDDVVLLDRDADGTLDAFERGEGNLADYQHAYRMVLDDGVRAGRIEWAEPLYVVRAQ